MLRRQKPDPAATAAAPMSTADRLQQLQAEERRLQDERVLLEEQAAEEREAQQRRGIRAVIEQTRRDVSERLEVQRQIEDELATLLAQIETRASKADLLQRESQNLVIDAIHRIRAHGANDSEVEAFKNSLPECPRRTGLMTLHARKSRWEETFRVQLLDDLQEFTPYRDASQILLIAKRPGAD